MNSTSFDCPELNFLKMVPVTTAGEVVAHHLQNSRSNDDIPDRTDFSRSIYLPKQNP